MLEIFAIYKFCQLFGKQLRAKGRRPTGYQALFVGMWFVFEIMGYIAGALVTESQGGAYGMGILGAFGAVLLMWYIIKLAPPKETAAVSYGFPMDAAGGPPPLPKEGHVNQTPGS